MRAADAGTQAAELLDCESWRTLCEKLRSWFGFVIFDAPPIGPLADYDLVEVVSDGVVLVVRPDHTTRAALDDALTSTPADRLIGIVLNEVPKYLFHNHHSYYPYAYAGHYSSAEEASGGGGAA
jgi:Mrp family chromosome partitioning ATPase